MSENPRRNSGHQSLTVGDFEKLRDESLKSHQRDGLLCEEEILIKKQRAKRKKKIPGEPAEDELLFTEREGSNRSEG